MKRSLSFYPILKGIVEGSITAFIPGLHPMVYGALEPIELGVVYGVFTGISVVLAEKGLFHTETAGQGTYKLKSILLGILLGMLLIPLAFIVYSIRLPSFIVLVILLVGSLVLARRDMITFFLSGLLGLIVLRIPVNVVSPLTSALFYIFGLLYLFGGNFSSIEGDWKRGVLSAFITGYIPALPPSTWSKILGNADTAVAAALTPMFSLVALMFGATRSALSAYVQLPYTEILVLVGLSYLLSILFVLSLSEILNIKKLSLPKEVGLAVLLGQAITMGLGNLLLFLAALGLVSATKSNPSAYFGFIVIPTLLYYV